MRNQARKGKHCQPSTPLQPWNSVQAAAPGGGGLITYAYDAARHQLAVGRPAENIVSLFTSDQVFANNFQ